MTRTLVQVHFKETQAIDVLLTRAIETEDGDALVLTREDRKHASAAALGGRPLPDLPTSPDRRDFLGRRAAVALERVMARYPALERARGLSRWPAWISWAMPLAALAAGLATDIIGGGNRLHILAFPLLALIAWNLVLFLAMAVRALRGSRTNGGGGPLLHALGWIVRPASARLAGQPALERAVLRYSRDWAEAAGPLNRTRASRTFHLAAALFAAGVLGGMLLRARYGGNYSAHWGGTWAGAEAEVALLLKGLLGPASVITGIPLPGVDRLRELRNSQENAGNWLILWSVTAALFVILPRLLLSALSTARAAFLARRIPVPEDLYVRSLLRNASGRSANVRVLPYGFAPNHALQELVARLVTGALGSGSRVRIDPAIDYGDEDSWLIRESALVGEADQIIILFNLGSTPEEENHGAFVAGVKRLIGGSGTGLMVLVDDSGFRQKLAGQASSKPRLEQRLEAWQTVLAPAGVSPVVISLDPADERISAQKIEQALLNAEVQA